MKYVIYAKYDMKYDNIYYMKYAKYDVYVKICTICNCYIVTNIAYSAFNNMQNITNMNKRLDELAQEVNWQVELIWLNQL